MIMMLKFNIQQKNLEGTHPITLVFNIILNKNAKQVRNNSVACIILLFCVHFLVFISILSRLTCHPVYQHRHQPSGISVTRHVARFPHARRSQEAPSPWRPRQVYSSGGSQYLRPPNPLNNNSDRHPPSESDLPSHPFTPPATMALRAAATGTPGEWPPSAPATPSRDWHPSIPTWRWFVTSTRM